LDLLYGSIPKTFSATLDGAVGSYTFDISVAGTVTTLGPNVSIYAGTGTVTAGLDAGSPAGVEVTAIHPPSGFVSPPAVFQSAVGFLSTVE